MLKKIVVIALIGLMVGGLAMGVISLAAPSAERGRGQERVELEGPGEAEGQRYGQRQEVTGPSATARGRGSFEGEHESCDCDDCTSGEGHAGEGRMSAGSVARGRGSEQASQLNANQQPGSVRNSGRGTGALGSESGRGQFATEQAASAANSVGGRFAREQATSAGNTGNGQGGMGAGSDGNAELVEQLTVESTVVAIGEHIIIELANGTELELGIGPEFYREEIGFEVEVGDELTVTGFHEDGEFKVISILDESNTLLIFRDEYGRPGWSGRGNRKNS